MHCPERRLFSSTRGPPCAKAGPPAPQPVTQGGTVSDRRFFLSSEPSAVRKGLGTSAQPEVHFGHYVTTPCTRAESPPGPSNTKSTPALPTVSSRTEKLQRVGKDMRCLNPEAGPPRKHGRSGLFASSTVSMSRPSAWSGSSNPNLLQTRFAVSPFDPFVFPTPYQSLICPPFCLSLFSSLHNGP